MTDSRNSTNPLGFPPWHVGGFPPTQGEEAMSKLSRRSLVAGAASLPALTAGSAVAIEANAFNWLICASCSARALAVS
jgi:hypothetical protein